MSEDGDADEEWKRMLGGGSDSPEYPADDVDGAEAGAEEQAACDGEPGALVGSFDLSDDDATGAGNAAWADEAEEVQVEEAIEDAGADVEEDLGDGAADDDAEMKAAKVAAGKAGSEFRDAFADLPEEDPSVISKTKPKAKMAPTAKIAPRPKMAPPKINFVSQKPEAIECAKPTSKIPGKVAIKIARPQVAEQAKPVAAASPQPAAVKTVKIKINKDKLALLAKKVLGGSEDKKSDKGAKGKSKGSKGAQLAQNGKGEKAAGKKGDKGSKGKGKEAKSAALAKGKNGHGDGAGAKGKGDKGSKGKGKTKESLAAPEGKRKRKEDDWSGAQWTGEWEAESGKKEKKAKKAAKDEWDDTQWAADEWGAADAWGEDAAPAKKKKKSGPDLYDKEGRQFDLDRVVVNFANVGASYGKKCLKRNDKGLFDWEGVRRCVRHLRTEKKKAVVGVIFENFMGTDCGSTQRRPIPQDISRMCESVEETPKITGNNHGSADDEMTIKCAYRRNCCFLDNDNYRDWVQQMRDERIRKWLDFGQELLHMRYFFDTSGFFETIDGNIPEHLLAQGRKATAGVSKQELWYVQR